MRHHIVFGAQNLQKVAGELVQVFPHSKNNVALENYQSASLDKSSFIYIIEIKGKLKDEIINVVFFV